AARLGAATAAGLGAATAAGLGTATAAGRDEATTPPRLDGVGLTDLGLHRLRGFDDRTRLYQIVAPGLPQDFPRPKTVDDRCHNLPEPLTRFVGRARDRAELAALVRRHRLVTVWGTGGVGKTRLAVEVARDLLRPVQPVPPHGATDPATDRLADGAWLIDLAELGSRHARDRSVAGLLAAELGLRPGPGQRAIDVLIEHLQPRRCLLLVDTCEVARGAVRALLARLLASCPLVRVLATSRTPLGVPGEMLWHLDPLGRVESTELLADRLGAPGDGRSGDGRAGMSSDGRAGMVGMSGDGRAGGLARLAGQLAGLPAALELAVPRLRALPAAVVADLLGGPDADPDAVLGAGAPPADLDWPMDPRQPANLDRPTGPDGRMDPRQPANLDWSADRDQPPSLGWPLDPDGPAAPDGSPGRDGSADLDGSLGRDGSADLDGSLDREGSADLDGSTDPDRPVSRQLAGDGVGVPDRQVSLNANLAWSYRLLSPPAARLLRWLAAWPGALDLAAVEWLTADWLDRGTACVAIADLVDAALVEVDLTATSATYRLLDPVRWPARRLAVAHGEAGRVRARHQLWQRQIAWVPTLQPLGEPVAG
ncbi:AAA family ATPase, partial [Actinocatenispora comari]|uniref:AAA family ATPase n=1 Tax=Actinocatenispora comari TaxID=2807577 RepID=UPI003519E143